MAAIGPGIAIVLSGLVFTLASEALAGRGGVSRRRAARRAAAAAAAVGTSTAGAAAGTGTPDGAPAHGTVSSGPTPVAQVRDLRVAFPDGEDGLVERVCGVTLSVGAGETVGIVGESGSGKSLTAMALAGLLEQPAVVTASARRFGDIDMDRPLSRADAGRVGTGLGMVFQDPLTSLNPALTIGRQLTEVSEVHLGLSRKESRARAAEALRVVRIPDPAARLRKYPHEFSGGMRQRAMIGMALTGSPSLIVADEPTTALDVTVQRQVLAVLRRAQRDSGAAIVFISHDIALVSAFCDRVVVMKDGRVVEELDARRIREDAEHPYTRALIACLPDLTSDRSRPLPVIPTETPVPEDSREGSAA